MRRKNGFRMALVARSDRAELTEMHDEEWAARPRGNRADCITRSSGQVSGEAQIVRRKNGSTDPLELLPRNLRLS